MGKIIYPSKIKKEDTIGITAPSSGILGKPYSVRLENAHKNFKHLGYQCMETDTVSFCNQFEEGILWYLENCELTVPALYRTLFQMKQAG